MMVNTINLKNKLPGSVPVPARGERGAARPYPAGTPTAPTGPGGGPRWGSRWWSPMGVPERPYLPGLVPAAPALPGRRRGRLPPPVAAPGSPGWRGAEEPDGSPPPRRPRGARDPGCWRGRARPAPPALLRSWSRICPGPPPPPPSPAGTRKAGGRLWGPPTAPGARSKSPPPASAGRGGEGSGGGHTGDGEGTGRAGAGTARSSRETAAAAPSGVPARGSGRGRGRCGERVTQPWGGGGPGARAERGEGNRGARAAQTWGKGDTGRGYPSHGVEAAVG